MRDALVPYPGQFELSPDPLYVAIPRNEILREMSRRGDARVLDDVCFAVALVADLLTEASPGQAGV